MTTEVEGGAHFQAEWHLVQSRCVQRLSLGTRVIKEQHNPAGRPVDNLDARRHATVGQPADNAMIEAAFSFNPRQHQHQTTLHPVRGAQGIEQCARKPAKGMQQDAEY